MDEASLKLFIENAPIGAAMFDSELRYMALSKRWLADHKIDSIRLGDSHYEVFPEIPERWRDVHRRALGGETIRAEEDSFDRRGFRIWLRWEVRPWQNASGAIGGIVIFTEDMTPQKQAEEALQQILRRQKMAQSAAKIGIWDRNLQDGRLYLNDEFYELHGLPAQSQLTYDVFLSLLHPDDRARIDLETQAARAGKAAIDTEYRIRRGTDGEIRWIRSKGGFECDDSGRAVSMMGAVYDVTERRRAEEALENALRRQNLVQSAARIGIWDWDLRADETYLNDEWYDLFGVTRGERLSYEDFLSLVHRDDRRAVTETMEAAFAGDQRFGMDMRIVRANDGEMRWVASKGEVQIDADGTPLRAMGAVYDITERKLLEQQLRKSDERKDLFIATLSHELRNPLAAVTNAVAALRRCEGEDFLTEEQKNTAIRIASQQTAYLKQLVEDLMQISRVTRGKIDLRKKRVDLPELVREAVSGAQPLIERKDQKLYCDIEGALRIDADPLRIVQALGNLIDNAAKYTPCGGRIHVSAKRRGKDAVVIVRDEGKGIPEQYLDRIFEPFRQLPLAKTEVPKGLGIGLALAREFVRMHGGRVEARSKGQDQGAEFIVHLPLAEDGEQGAERERRETVSI